MRARCGGPHSLRNAYHERIAALERLCRDLAFARPRRSSFANIRRLCRRLLFPSRSIVRAKSESPSWKDRCRLRKDFHRRRSKVPSAMKGATAAPRIEETLYEIPEPV